MWKIDSDKSVKVQTTGSYFGVVDYEGPRPEGTLVKLEAMSKMEAQSIC